MQTIKQFFGALVCRFRGHRERRVQMHKPIEAMGYIFPAYNRECTRCGATRLAKARKRKEG